LLTAAVRTLAPGAANLCMSFVTYARTDERRIQEQHDQNLVRKPQRYVGYNRRIILKMHLQEMGRSVCVNQDEWEADNSTHNSGVSKRFIEWMRDCQRGASCMLSEICAVIGYCPNYNGDSLRTFRDKLPLGLPSFSGHFLDFLALEVGTDGLFRNVDNELPP
jgi:hypothetical protein